MYIEIATGKDRAIDCAEDDYLERMKYNQKNK
jgi:hypothetical protein